MRWTRLILLIMVVVLLVFGAGFTFLLTLDLNNYKAEIERFVVRETGRAFFIDGQIDLDFGSLTSLAVTDVRIGNPDWAAREDMASIGRASVYLDLRSLLSGPVDVVLVELYNTELNLEQLDSGENNWTFGNGSTEVSGGLIPFILRQGYISNFALTVALPAFKAPLEIRIDRLDQIQNINQLFDVKLHGTLNGRLFNVAGEYGPLESLLAAADLSADISGQFDTLSITVNGLIDDLVQPRRPRVNIEIIGPDIDHVTEMLGLPDLGHGDLNLKVTLEPVAQEIALSIEGRVGEHQVDSSGSVSDLLTLEKVSMRITAHGPDLNVAAEIFGVSQIPVGVYQLSGAVTRDGPLLNIDEISLDIGEAQFQLDGSLTRFPDLNDANLTLEIHGNDVGQFTRLFGLPGVVEGPFQVLGHLKVDPDETEIINLKVITEILELAVTGELGEGLNFAGTRLSVSGRGASIGAIAALLNISRQTTEPFEFEGDIEIGQDILQLPGDIKFTVGSNQLIATGAIGFEPLGKHTDLSVRIQGSDLAQAGMLAGITKGVPVASFAASGRFQTPPEGYKISNLQARIGAAELSIDGLISRQENFIGTRLKIGVSGPELGEFIAGNEVIHLPEGPFEMSGDFELQADAFRLQGVAVKLRDAIGSINADIGLPLDSANGTFEAQVSGESFQAVLPKAGIWQPPEMPFEMRAQGRLEEGLLYVDPFTIHLGEAQVTARGAFDVPPDMTRTNLKIIAQADDLSKIGNFDNRTLPDTDFSLDAEFSGTTQSFSIKNLVVRSGASDLNGSVIAKLDFGVPDVNLQLHSSLLDVTPLMEMNFGVTNDSEDAVDDGGEKISEDGRAIPDWPLPLEMLTKFNAIVDIDVGRYQQNQRIVDNLLFDASARDGQLSIERIAGETRYGNFSAMLHIEPSENSAQVQATYEGENIFLGSTKGRTAEEIDTDPKFDISVALNGAGLTSREIVDSLNGQVRMSASKGKIANTALSYLYGNIIEEIFTVINPFAKKDPYTEISCAIFIAGIENGLLTAKPGMAVQTDKMNIISEGTINLRTEKLDIHFKTAPRKKISISAGEFINPYLKVVGTLSSPRLTLDATNTLVTGGAAVATAGLTLLASAVWDRISSSEDPCSEITRRAKN